MKARRSIMKAAFLWPLAPADRLRKALRDPKGIRKWLNTRRKKATPEEETEIWRALFELYGIHDQWPVEIQLEWLAGRLAAELFPRCQALYKPHGGGPSKKLREKMLRRKLRLLKKFKPFCHKHSHLSTLRAAEFFMEENQKECAAAGFTKPKSFSQAMTEISSATLRS
jgi:hypothetical protein